MAYTRAVMVDSSTRAHLDMASGAPDGRGYGGWQEERASANACACATDSVGWLRLVLVFVFVLVLVRIQVATRQRNYSNPRQ